MNGHGEPPGVIAGHRSAVETIVSCDDPVALLDFAWAMEPALRLSERYAALDRLEELLASHRLPAPPPGRDWQMELIAERAIDAAAYLRLSDGRELADRVLREADPSATIAIARATLAQGRALAWIGTEEATRQADQVLQLASARFADLRQTDWLGFTVFWRGHAIYFQNGDLDRARALIGEALTILAPDSQRRSPILTFYADVLTELGEFEAADAALDEAAATAERDTSARSRAYVAWSRAHVAAGRDDPAETARQLSAVERDATDWFATMTGLDFLADAAVQLDRVGLTRPSQNFLERARERVAREGATTEDGSSYDEPLRQAEAIILARSGDPHRALAALQELVRGNWLEKRLIWRNTLLTAWATLRTGERARAGTLAAQALTEAMTHGGLTVALASERQLTNSLAPLAAEVGSAPARELLTDGDRAVVRLFGTASVEHSDGTPIVLPAGMPGALIRWLAVTPTGLETGTVLSEFFPEVALDTARARLRQVLARVRSEAGDLVLRDGDRLTLVPAWVDVRAFGQLAAEAARATGGRRLTLAWSALALAERGPLLVSDPYAAWAEAAREEAQASTAHLSTVLA